MAVFSVLTVMTETSGAGGGAAALDTVSGMLHPLMASDVVIIAAGRSRGKTLEKITDPPFASPEVDATDEPISKSLNLGEREVKSTGTSRRVSRNRERTRDCRGGL